MIQKSPDWTKTYTYRARLLCGAFSICPARMDSPFCFYMGAKRMGQLVPALYGCLYFCDDVVFLYGDLLQGGNKR